MISGQIRGNILALSFSFFRLSQSSGFVPSLVNLNEVPDLTAWLEDPNNEYIGRRCYRMRVASIWANPYKITKSVSREQCVENFKTYFENNETLQEVLPQICAKTFGCWWIPQSYHGHVLIKAFNEMLRMDLDFICEDQMSCILCFCYPYNCCVYVVCFCLVLFFCF